MVRVNWSVDWGMPTKTNSIALDSPNRHAARRQNVDVHATVLQPYDFDAFADAAAKDSVPDRPITDSGRQIQVQRAVRVPLDALVTVIDFSDNDGFGGHEGLPIQFEGGVRSRGILDPASELV